MDQVQLEQLLVPGQGVELSLEVWPAVDWRSALREAWQRRERARASAAQQTAGTEQVSVGPAVNLQPRPPAGCNGSAALPAPRPPRLPRRQ